MTAEQQRSEKLAKRNNQLKRERDTAKRTAMAVSATLRNITIKQAAAGREEAWGKVEAACALKKAPVTLGTCRASQTYSHITAAAPVDKQDGPNSSKPSVLGGPIKAEKLVTREPFSVISDKQVTVQAAGMTAMPAISSPASAVPGQEWACCVPYHTRSAQENVAPAASGFTFGFRRPTYLDTGKPIFAAPTYSPVEARTFTAMGQRLSPMTASEAHSHVNPQVPSKAKQDSKLSNAALDKSPLAAREADKIDTADSIVPSATATAVSSAASTSHSPATGTEADNKHAIKICTPTPVNINNKQNPCSCKMAVAIPAMANSHVPAPGSTQISSVAAAR